MGTARFLTRTKSLVLVAMMGILSGPLRAGISLGPEKKADHWKRLRFGSGWTYPPDKETSRWPPHAQFRYQGGRLFIATTVEVPGGRTLQSSNHYGVTLDKAVVERVDQAQWNSAPLLVTRVESPFHSTPNVIDYKEVVYGDRRFRGRSDRLNGNRSYALSPDGSWLALMSWQGKVPACQDFFCDGTIARGQLFIEIFNVATGELETALTGRFLFDEPFETLDTVVWLSDRHLLVLTNNAKEGWMADMRPAQPATDAAWEVIQSAPEILGFWEDQPKFVYTHYLPSPLLHFTVRLPNTEQYALRGYLRDSSGDGTPGSSISSLPYLHPAGLNTLSFSFGYHTIKIPGTYIIGELELVDRNRNVVARMEDAGPTENYPDTLELERALPKQYPPWWNTPGNPKPPGNTKPIEAFGVLPKSGIGPSAMFQIAVLPPYLTWENVAIVELLFNDRLEEKGGCWISFLGDLKPNDRRRLILHGDDGRGDLTSFLSEGGVYSAKAVENSRCSIEKGWKPLLEGVTQIPVSFKPSFFGQKNVYIRVTDDQARTSGWKHAGTWAASDERRPEAVSVIPYLGEGVQKTFTFAISDQNGSTDITDAEFLVQSGRSDQQACYFSLDRSSGLITLREDQGTAARGTIRLGERGQVGNSQCTISNANLKLEGRDSISLSIHIQFSSGFSGRRNIYARVRDKAAMSSSMVWLGSWLVANR